MNPASSVPVTAAGFSGMTVALVVMGLVIVVLALLYVKDHFPKSSTAQFVTGAEADASKFASTVAADIRKVEPSVKLDIQKIELGVDKTLVEALASVEKRLLDTSGEDAAIATAQSYLARVTAEVQASVQAANDAKAAKVAAMQAHVATLSTGLVPVTGS